MRGEGLYRVFDAWKRAELGWKRGRLAWVLGATSRLDAMLGPLVWSAGDLVTAGQPRRLKSCGSDACGWLFYDESRGERRRWYSMSDCGNRAKARRFYARVTRRRLSSDR